MRQGPEPTGRLSGRETALLGLPSLALGVGPLVAPRACARLLGLDPDEGTIIRLRLVGVRELVVALVFLTRRSPAWLWGFVAQDAMDLPLCCRTAWRAEGAGARRFRRACLAYGGLAVVDVYTAVSRNLRRRSGGG